MVTRNQLTTVAIAALVVTAVVIAAVVYFAVRIKARGSIRTVGLEAYADPEATTGVDFIDWGTLNPGGHGNVTVYLKSTSNVPSNLSLSSESWEPEVAATYITVSWDYDESPLAPGEIRAVVFTLDVAMDIVSITEFTFDIVITAAG